MTAVPSFESSVKCLVGKSSDVDVLWPCLACLVACCNNICNFGFPGQAGSRAEVKLFWELFGKIDYSLINECTRKVKCTMYLSKKCTMYMWPL